MANLKLIAAIALALLPAIPAVASERIQVDSSEQTSGGGVGNPAQVSSHVILADGSHVALWCQYYGRRCVILRKGTYDADVDLSKGVIWIYTQSNGTALAAQTDQGKGKIHKVKYRVSGVW